MDRAANYREHFETYEAPQGVNPTQQQQQQQRKEDGGGTKSKTRYLEFAETEFIRPSFYLPIPFVAPAGNQLQAIPTRTLSQLIKQHIARNRMKQLASQTPSYLRAAQSRVKELRQTPFRRWPTNSSILSYAEKRRQWKMELKRRLKGEKVRTRFIPPLLISGGGHSSTQTDTEPENRYYVTYSPQTRIYQVSRRPPPYLYTTDQDALPQQLDGEPPQQVDAEPGQQQEMDEEQPKAAKPPLIGTMGADNSFSTTEGPSAEENSPTTEESATTTPMPSSPPLLMILQNAELMSNSQSSSEHSQWVEAMKATAVENEQPLKQILFLDDYEQVQGDEEFNETDSGPMMVDPLSLATEAAETPTVPSFGERERSAAEEEDEFAEGENEEEDLFFFKPAGGTSSSS
uniref:Nuclear transcription factor Y subunit n=1 Tax=Globodera pallida TaxID=36090 RepID=A0A183CAM6_GLOPA